MSRTYQAVFACSAIVSAALVLSRPAAGDEFTDADVEHWTEQYQAAVTAGRALWVDGALGSNGVACAQCHPNAANTHPETYPKYQKQLGRVVTIGEMINWCIENPLEGEPLAMDSKEMVAIQAYVTWERRGVTLDPGKH